MADRKPVVLLPNNSLAELPAGDSLAWSLLSGVPVYATRWPTWDEVSGKPATFAPAAHAHSASDITSGTLSDARLPSTMGGKTFTSPISAPGVGLGDQQGYIYQSNSAGAVGVRVGTEGNLRWFAFGEDGRFYANSGGAYFNGAVDSGQLTVRANDAHVNLHGGANDSATNRNIGLVHNKSSGNLGIYDQRTSTWLLRIAANNNAYFASDITAYASDGRLKKNVLPVDTSLVEDFFDRFQVREFDWDKEAIEKLHPGFTPKAPHEVGAIAQEVAEVYPLMVSDVTEDGIKTIQWERAVPLLIAEVQALRARVAELEGRM